MASYPGANWMCGKPFDSVKAHLVECPDKDLANVRNFDSFVLFHARFSSAGRVAVEAALGLLEIPHAVFSNL